jgi:hypothetical protein
LSGGPSVFAVILSNLVRNAIKYVGEGSERVRRITLRERFQDRSLLLEVETPARGCHRAPRRGCSIRSSARPGCALLMASGSGSPP